MTMLLSMVDGNAEQATLQSVTVVVPPEQDSDDEDVLVVLELLELLEGWDELIDLLVVDAPMVSN